MNPKLKCGLTIAAMKSQSLTIALTFLVCLTRITWAAPLSDMSILLEDGGEQDVVILFEGPNGSFHDIAVTRPGAWGIDLEDLPPDNYRVTLYSPGYASQRLSVTYRDGQFSAAVRHLAPAIVLYRLRWVALELVWNAAGSRELTGADVRREVFATSGGGANHPVILPDYRIIQTQWLQRSHTTGWLNGKTLAFARHRFTDFFGVAYPEPGNDFDSATIAPTNDFYQRDSIVPLEDGSWFFLRISGHRPEMITYAKVRVVGNSLQPPTGIEVLPQNRPSWVETWERSGREMPDKLRILLPE